MSDDSKIVPAGSELASEQGSAIRKKIEYWELNQALREVVERVGDSVNRLDRTQDYKQWWADVEAGIDPNDTGWWEALSHGLVMPLDGDFRISEREQDKGFYDKLQDLEKTIGLEAAYIQLETDFLRFDEKGFNRQCDENYPQPIVLNKTGAQILFLRVTTFGTLRSELEKQGVVLPDNPVWEEAKEAVKDFFKTTPVLDLEKKSLPPHLQRSEHPRLGPSGNSELPSH